MTRATEAPYDNLLALFFLVKCINRCTYIQRKVCSFPGQSKGPREKKRGLRRSFGDYDDYVVSTSGGLLFGHCWNLFINHFFWLATRRWNAEIE